MDMEEQYQKILDNSANILQRNNLPVNEKYAQLFNQIIFSRVQLLTEMLRPKLGNKILAGPFQGMIFHKASTEGCYLPKLLGCYEAELHLVLEEFKNKNIKQIIDVGCAEGYYAVGLARLMPQAKVLAFDIEETAQQACDALAKMNAVDTQVTTSGELTPQRLDETITSDSLIFCDCEGCEYALLDPEKVKKLKHANLIVEMHNTDSTPQVAQAWLVKFKDTHDIRIVSHNGRNPNVYPALRNMKHFDQWLCVWEFRGGPTPWAIITPKV